jgi:signal peptidase II
MKKPSISLRIVAMFVMAILVAADQLLKEWAQGNLRLAENRRVLIPGVVGLTYAENTGISFGLLGDAPTVMLMVTILTAVVMLVALVLLLMGKFEPAAMWAVVLIIAGGMGNFIDRVMQGYVVDYIEFLFMRFAIFNLADVLITCGMAMLVVVMIRSERRRAREAK